jgi:very long chain acyl-CoA dehydrogenase
LFIYSLGIQYAGAHLKELQNAFKNPAANLGLIFEEASKRVVRSVGLASPPALNHFVHRDLANPATQLAKVFVQSGVDSSIDFFFFGCRKSMRSDKP